MMRFVFSIGLIGLFLGTTGCVNLDPQPDPTRFYTLSPIAIDPSLEGGAWRVEVAPLPAYLQTKRLALRVGAHEVIYRDFDRWTGSLDSMLQERLREALRIELGDAARPTGLASIKFLRFEAAMSGAAVLVADYRLVEDGAADSVRRGRYSEELSLASDPDGGEIVAALGSLLDGLAAAMAAEF